MAAVYLVATNREFTDVTAFYIYMGIYPFSETEPNQTQHFILWTQPNPTHDPSWALTHVTTQSGIGEMNIVSHGNWS